MRNDTVVRFFGGSPVWVIIRLAVASFLLGIVLAAFGVSPFDIVSSLKELLFRLYDRGFEVFAWAWRYFLLGAVIVVPVWLAIRLIRFTRREDRQPDRSER